MVVYFATGSLVYIVGLATLLPGNGCSASVLTHRAAVRATGDLCRELWNGFYCANCKTLVHCIEGEAQVETCSEGDTCLKTPDFGGAVCQPVMRENCACSGDNKFHADAYDPRAFFFCRDELSEPEMHQCSIDKEFDALKQQCVSRDGLPECVVPGIFSDYRNCSQYYSCIVVQDGWVKRSYSCKKGTMYNEDTGLCEDPCSWPSEKFTCKAEGRFPDPLSCKNYYECVSLPDGSTLRQYHKQCPHGYAWKHDAQSGRGRCVGQAEASCSPVKLGRCVLTELKCSKDLEARISALETKKVEKDQEIREVEEVVKTLRTTGNMVGGIFLMIQQVPRPGELRESSNPDNKINGDAEVILTVTPYCSGVWAEDAFKGSLTDVISTVLEGLRKAVTDDLFLLPCLTDVLSKLVDNLNSGDFILGPSALILEEPAVKTIQAIKTRHDEKATVLGELQNERDEVERELARLKTLLESHIENTA
ncbi:uncharacterized protein LOC135196093 [Macrobrachium nipponense]|uniref:uncharacterized protein LOC135196093 n=1 Tax=Macrobrachium nipponense TaxID=159736 RepID=UPI0030C8915A